MSEKERQKKDHKRTEVLQAAGADQNIGTAEDEDAARSSSRNPKRPKAGR